MASFLDKLRNSNVFGNPFDPPRQNPFELVDQFMRRNPQLNDIGQQVLDSGGNNGGRQVKPLKQESPMDPIFIDNSMTPYQKAQIDIRRDELSGRQNLGQGNLGVKSRGMDIQQQRANANDFKIKNPNHVMKVGPDGHLRAINPQTNEVTDLGETGMGQQEIADMNQNNKLQQIGMQGWNAENLAGINNTASMDRTKQTGLNAVTTKETPSGTPNIPSASDDTKRAQLKYNQLINANPTYRKFVKLDADGMPQIVEPGGKSWFGLGGDTGPTKDQYDEINNAIYGSGGEKVEPKVEIPPKVDNTSVVVIKDGKKFKLPKAQLAEAITQGYKEVK